MNPSVFHIKNSKVYFKDRELSNLDGSTFAVIYILDYLKKSNLKAYLKDKNGVWWFEEKKKKVELVTNDIEHFKVTENENYALDSTTVYHYQLPIPNSNAKSFETFVAENPYFAKDKNQVYAYADYIGKVEIVKDVDAISFLPCGWSQFGTDKHNLFHFYDFTTMANVSKYAKPIPDNWNELQLNTDFEDFNVKDKYHDKKEYWWNENYPFQPKNTALIQPARSKNHYYNQNAVFYKGGEGEPNLIPNLTYEHTAVLNSFFCLWHYYNIKAVFYKQFRLKNADFATFKVLYKKIAKDKNKVFFGRNPVQNADVSSFEIIVNSYDNSDFVAKDKNYIYRSVFKRFEKFSALTETLEPIKKIDVSQFQFIGKNWATDGNVILCKLKPLPKIDVKSFKLLFSDEVNDWAIDKNHLYNANGIKTYKNIEGKSFQYLNRFWGKDKNNVFSFYTERILKNADAKTFKILGSNGKAEDKNFIYTIDSINCIIKKNKK